MRESAAISIESQRVSTQQKTPSGLRKRAQSEATRATRAKSLTLSGRFVARGEGRRRVVESGGGDLHVVPLFLDEWVLPTKRAR